MKHRNIETGNPIPEGWGRTQKLDVNIALCWKQNWHRTYGYDQWKNLDIIIFLITKNMGI